MRARPGRTPGTSDWVPEEERIPELFNWAIFFGPPNARPAPRGRTIGQPREMNSGVVQLRKNAAAGLPCPHALFNGGPEATGNPGPRRLRLAVKRAHDKPAAACLFSRHLKDIPRRQAHGRRPRLGNSGRPQAPGQTHIRTCPNRMPGSHGDAGWTGNGLRAAPQSSCRLSRVSPRRDGAGCPRQPLESRHVPAPRANGSGRQGKAVLTPWPRGVEFTRR